MKKAREILLSPKEVVYRWGVVDVGTVYRYARLLKIEKVNGCWLFNEEDIQSFEEILQRDGIPHGTFSKIIVCKDFLIVSVLYNESNFLGEKKKCLYVKHVFGVYFVKEQKTALLVRVGIRR